MSEWWSIFTLGFMTGAMLSTAVCALVLLGLLSIDAFARNYGEAGGPPNERVPAHGPWSDDNDDAA